MARRPELEAFAAEHGIKIGTIADLIHYRLIHERTVERIAEQPCHGPRRCVGQWRDAVDEAVAKAIAGQKVWGAVPLYERGRILRRFVEIALSKKEELASLFLPLAPVTLAMMERTGFDRLCGTQTPQGVIGEFDQPAAPSLSPLESGLSLIVVLDEVQDPGNVGTSIRVAAGLGAEGVLLTQGCADLWNPKVVRASAGAVLHVPVWRGINSGDAAQILSSARYTFWIADASGESLFSETRIPERLVLVLGNESHGASLSWLEVQGARRIGLPMDHGVESLNVGTALAALLGSIRGMKLSPT